MPRFREITKISVTRSGQQKAIGKLEVVIQHDEETEETLKLHVEGQAAVLTRKMLVGSVCFQV